jgi:hypothetical protein
VENATGNPRARGAVEVVQVGRHAAIVADYVELVRTKLGLPDVPAPAQV